MMNSKKRIGLMVAGCLAFGALFSHADVNAVAKKSVKVGGKSVEVRSTIARMSASGASMSDGTVKATVESKYTYALGGKQYTDAKKATSSSTITSVGFTAPPKGQSLTISSRHVLVYGGDKTIANTSAAY